MRSNRRKVIFITRPATETKKGGAPRQEGARPSQNRPLLHVMAQQATDFFHVPQEFKFVPSLGDGLTTQTSIAQAETVTECLPYLKAAEGFSRNTLAFNTYGVPRLEREDHVNFLNYALGQMPAPFVGVDSARPWLIYWALMGLYLLGEDVTRFRAR